MLKGVINRMKIITLVEDTKGVDGCGYEHGLSLYIETENHKLLMDCGTTDMFLKNAEVLGVDLSQVDSVFLSHGHYDHSGGIIPFSKYNSKAKIYLQKTAGEDYYHLTEEMEKYAGIDKKILGLSQSIILDGDKKIDEELFVYSNISGERCLPKGNQEMTRKIDGVHVRDTFDHEQCLVITEGEKKVLLSGCAHNGILNIVDKYKELFGNYPDIVISGFHMIQKGEYTKQDIDTIKETAFALMETGAIYFSGHCTGTFAYGIMKEIMGGKLQSIHSGKRLV